ncbi:PAS domain S-box protein [Oscillatoria sp. FACHB-1407]|nr:PAS domain S-box protein [Oscillatoria sp. FACHB-1407]
MMVYQRLLPYGVAIGSTAIALLLSLWLDAVITRTIGAFFYIAIAISTWYGGRKPGMVAIALSLLALNYYFIPPIHQIQISDLNDVLRLALFLIVALIINLLSVNLQKSRSKVEQLNRQLIAESSDRLRVALNAAQMGMWDWNIVSGEINWSPEHEQLLGLSPGSFDGKYETFDACLHPDDREGLNQAIAHSLQNRVPYHHEFRVVWADGSVHWVEGRGQAFYGENGQPVRMSGTIMAIDDRKQAQILLQKQLEQQRLVLEVTQRIRQSLKLQEILQTTVDEVRHFLQTDRVIIFRFFPDWRGQVVVESCGADWTAILSTEIYDPCFGEDYVEPFRQGLVTTKSDIYTAGMSDCHRELLSRFQVRANLVVPITADGVLWGLLIAHHCEAPRQWQDSEIDLLRQIAFQLGIAIQQSALFEQIQTELVERQQVEESLRQSEARLRLAQIASNSAVWDWDVQKNILFWSPEYYQLYNLDATVEPSYENWLRCLHPDDREKVSQQTLQALEDNSSDLRIEFRVLSTDEIRWFAGIGQVLRDEAGKPIRMIGITIDITQQKQTEILLQQFNTDLEQRVAERTEELNALNNRLLIVLKEQHQANQEVEDLYNKAPCGYHSLDVEGTIIRINDTELSWLGYTRDEVLNQMKFTDFVTPESQQTFHQNFPQFIQRGWVNGLEFQLRHKDGSTRWVTVNAIAIRDDAGNFVMSRTSMFDISERKRSEAERKLTEQVLALQAVITRNMAEGVCLVKADDATIVYANPKFEQMFGYGSGELNGQHVSIVNYATETISADDVTQSIRSAVLQNLEATYEVHNVKKDGTPFWCSATCSVFKHPEYGDVLVAVQQDISERKQAETALKQQTRQKQLLWTITQAIRQSLNLDHILNSAVTEVRQLLEVDRSAIYRFNTNWSGDFIVESVADGWIKLVEPEVCKLWEDTYLQEHKGGRFKEHETLTVADIYAANLQPCHIELLEQFQAKAYAISPIFVGESLWGLFAIYHNRAPHRWESWEIELLQQIASQLAIALQQSELYSQLQTELQERKQAEVILQEAERRWRSLLDNVQLLVVGLDQSGNVNYVNTFFLNLTGYTQAETLGKNWFANFLPPSNQSILQGVFSEVLLRNAYPYYQNSILTKSGEERFIGWNNTMLQDFDGNIIGTISIGEDITERQKVEQIKNEFIGIVSHELRTPLTSIQMSLGLLQSGIYTKKPEKAQRMVEIALLDTNRLVNLVNDILDLERLESGRTVVEKVVCQAADLMQQAVDSVQAIASQQNITFTIIPAEVTVWAAPDMILQTLTNLLGNAIKFSPAHSVITLQAQRQNDYVLFQVVDQGRGIPADKTETIFGRFQQVDASDSREKGGTGLGLPICRSIIERHGGRIWAESTLGKGSTFSFTLPVEDTV